MICGCMVNTHAPPSSLMPRNSSAHSVLTCPVVEMVLVQLAPSNQKCGASSRIQEIGTSTRGGSWVRYGRMASIRVEEEAKPCSCSRASVCRLRFHDGER